MLRQIVRTVKMVKRGISPEIEYNSWTREDLIKKINLLERQIQVPQKIASETVTPESKVTTSIESKSLPSDSTKLELTSKEPSKKKKKQKEFDFDKYPQRFIALRFAYLGWNYSGLAYQYEPAPLPTIEELILKALHMSKLISKPEPNACEFSRCGRTDRGVSAMNQVISLNVRSALSIEEQLLPENDQKEIPYLNILNSLLPADIRVHGISLRPTPGFDARFSCEHRHYKYLFKSTGLDLELMKKAASYYRGSNDFRNFCKIDGSKQITNYRRQVHSAEILHHKDDFHVFDLKGSAFLWHQVRCMVAVMLLVGQGLEKPEIVLDLLDVEKYPRKPAFEMASDLPLVLFDCTFPDMEWISPMEFNGAQNKLFKGYMPFKELLHENQVKAHVTTMMESVFMKDADKMKHNPGAGAMNVGNGAGRNFAKYLPLAKRETMATFEVVNERHKAKKLLKLEIEKENQKALDEKK